MLTQTTQDILKAFASVVHLDLSICYGIYDSPKSFRLTRGKPLRTSKSILPDANQTISVTLQQPLGSGAAGIVHYATATVTTPNSVPQTFPIAAKVATVRAHRRALHHEHRIYRRLAAHNVAGVPVALGLFESDGMTLLLLTLEGAALSNDPRLSVETR